MTLQLWIFFCSLLFFPGCGKFFSSHLKLSGTLELTEHSVGARVPGRLAELLVDEGDEVRKDQRIGTLDRYEQAKKDFGRAAELFKRGGASEQSVELARLALEDQEMISPVDGTVLVKIREAGEVLGAGAPVVVIGDRGKLWIRVYVPEGFINRVKMGQEAVVRFDGLGKKFKGRVVYIASQAEFTPRNVQSAEERVTQTFAVKVAIEKPEPFMRPGVAADVDLKLD